MLNEALWLKVNIKKSSKTQIYKSVQQISWWAHKLLSL